LRVIRWWKSKPVLGEHVAHTPSFSQKNSRLYVFEHIDLSTSKINKAKERAGWMAYMFADIHRINSSSEAYSLIRPEKDSGVEQIEYAKAKRGGSAEIFVQTSRARINVSDDDPNYLPQRHSCIGRHAKRSMTSSPKTMPSTSPKQYPLS
jgi:hypothetical protein